MLNRFATLGHSLLTMAKELRLLDQVRVAAPCPANWEEMKGDDQVRHCSQCRHNVYNLSAMTDEEAEKLLSNATGRLCVRYYQRSDGKVMTKDCPKGLHALRQRAAKRFAIAISFILSAIGCGKSEVMGDVATPPVRQQPPVSTGNVVLPVPSTTGMVAPNVMGKVAIPEKQTPSKSGMEMGEVMYVPKKGK